MPPTAPARIASAHNGAYTSLQKKVSRTVDLGIRFDWFKADSKSWALGDQYAPLAVNTGNPHRWLVAPYLTWWQSPWVRLRLHYVYSSSDPRPTAYRHDHRVILQCTFAAGPHKHERY